MTHRHAVIMAGGSGTRLWPMSRAARPKQLMPMPQGGTLLQIAAARLSGVVPTDRQFVCASRSYAADILAAIPGLSADRFLGEPMGRDTLNAVGFAAAVAAARDPNATLAVLTSDHVIEPQDVFAQKLDLGFRLVEADPNRLVTFAITPTFPATGYGYVEQGDAIVGFAGAFTAKRFVEKPDLERATQFVTAGTFGWNSGMFIFHAATVLDAIDRFQPACGPGLRQIGAAWTTARAHAVVDEVYPTLTKISVDYGLMEPASRDAALSICAVPMPVAWRDVGSWPAYASLLPSDTAGNRASSLAVHLASRDVACISDDPSHLIATIGIEGVIVVRTADATLVCKAADAERVKELVALLPADRR